MLHGSDLQQPTKFEPEAHAYQVPPLGQEGLKLWREKMRDMLYCEGKKAVNAIERDRQANAIEKKVEKEGNLHTWQIVLGLRLLTGLHVATSR